MNSLSRRTVLKAAAAGVAMSAARPLAASPPVITPAPSGAPNIVWIFCDELRTASLGCYGYPALKLHTPNIDRLAASGAIFTNHFCNSPVCVPSRVATLTGRYPEQTGVYNNEGAWKNFRLPRLFETFPQVLHRNGYATANFGKIHVANGMYPRQTPDYEIFQKHVGEGGEMGFWTRLGEKRVGMIRSPSGGMQGGCFPAGEPYEPDKVAENGIAWIKKRKDTPFFARFSILQPHTPVIPKKEFLDLYADQDPGLPPPLPETVSAFEKKMAQLHGLDRMDREKLREARRCYFALVAWIDQQAGKIIDCLEQNGLTQNTLVLFGADHGTPNGDNGCFEKHSFAPCVHRVPLIMSWPGKIAPGTRRDDLSDSLDIGATVLAAAGVKKPGTMNGRDLLKSEPPEQIYATIGFGEVGSKMGPNGGRGDWFNGRGWPRRSCVRTAKYRLDMNTRIDGKPATDADRDVFFADVRSDPAEQKNLAGDPRHDGEVKRLTALLLAHAENSVEVSRECVTRVGKTEEY